MNFNKAHQVSMTTFAKKYAEVQKDGGNMDDLCAAVEMKKPSANVKLSQLREMWLEKHKTPLPALARCPRTQKDGTKSKQKIGDAALDILAGFFNETLPEDETGDESTDETGETDTDETNESTEESTVEQTV